MEVGLGSMDLTELRGVELMDYCLHCQRRGRWIKQDGVWRCSRYRCGYERPKRIVPLSRARSHESGNRTLETIADLGLIFDHLHLWEFRAWWSYVALGSYQRAFYSCRKLWPRREAGWSLRRVQMLTVAARERSQPRLERGGWI